MRNYVVPGPNGGIPSIKYIEHLKDAGILSPQIAEKQIYYINYYLKMRNINIKQKSEIIKKIIEKESISKINKV